MPFACCSYVLKCLVLDFGLAAAMLESWKGCGHTTAHRQLLPCINFNVFTCSGRVLSLPQIKFSNSSADTKELNAISNFLYDLKKPRKQVQSFTSAVLVLDNFITDCVRSMVCKF